MKKLLYEEKKGTFFYENEPHFRGPFKRDPVEIKAVGYQINYVM